jgi:hypothetical protein
VLQEGNLLVNGSMEGAYSAQDGIPQLQMPAGWRAWWIEGGPDPWSNLRPAWSNISASAGYTARVMSGDLAMRYFKGWATFTAGAYQTVSGITPGATLELTAWGHLWSCQDWGQCNEAREGLPPRVWSTVDPSQTHMKIGIDPTGGTDPFSGAVVWSGEAGALDTYVQFRVSAEAQADRVTVFLYASQDVPAENQDAYWDDAALRVAGGGEGGEGGEAPAAGFGVASIPTYPPREDGRIIHVVRPGETLGGIAVAYGLESAEEVRQLNNMPAGSFIIHTGQELLVGYAEGAGTEGGEAVGGGTAAPEAAGAETALTEEAAATPVAAALPTVATTGEICASLFEDANRNGVFEDNERLLGDGIISLKRGEQPVESYRTDGVSEPHCFADLEPGDYIVESTPPRAYGDTTSARLSVRVAAGIPYQIDFGAARGVETQHTIDEPPPASPTPAPAAPAQPTLTGRILNAVSQSAGIIVLAVAFGLVVIWVLWQRMRR